MPFSSDLCKAEIKNWLRELHPGTVLDVGAGSGTYSRLFRHILPWATWTAVEVHAPYVERFQLRQRYDEVLIANALDLELGAADPLYDVVLLGDVLEHLTEVDAARLLRNAGRWAGRGVIASVPLGHCPQGPSEGNEHERHVSEWTHGGFNEFLRRNTLRMWDEAEVRKDHAYTIGAYLWRS